MKISLNTIRYYNKLYNSVGEIAPDGVDALATKIGAQLGAIEEVIEIGSKYQGIVVAKVVKVEKHSNADKLHVCLIDDGNTVEGVKRNSDDLVQVVCGAPNVREGITVAWLPPGATVPESIGAGKEPFVLSARDLRGELSNGMLASSRELALSDSHAGILEIDGDVEPGTDFAEHFGLADDYVMDIENKMFTHRPDCFGFMGVSRELAGIQQYAYISPDWYRVDAYVPTMETTGLPLEFRNELPELVPRFSAVTMRGVKVGPSPVWLQVELAKLGMRPINNVVDATNWIMLLTGQPLHAYDYDKVMAQNASATHATIVVRQPREGEKIKLLNGKEIEPRAEAIMIATNDKLIGVGGVMGGAETEVDESTTNLIVECANFDMYSIRRTSMAHGLFTDAVTRFNKGQSPLQNRAVLGKIIDQIRELAGGKVASELIDDVSLADEVLKRGSLHAPVTVPTSFINERLGFELTAEDMKTILMNVEFTVEVKADELVVTAPFWRTDIEIPEDVVEEVGRLYGFDNLPLVLPLRSLEPAVKNPSLEVKQQIRETLTKSGANEVLTYSFVHGKLLQRVGQDLDEAYKLSNALSPDLQYVRLSLTPSLLDKIHPNIKAGHDSFALFEIGKGRKLSWNEKDEPGLPYEEPLLAFVYAAADKKKSDVANQNAAFFQARKYLDTLLAGLNGTGKVTLRPFDSRGEAGKQVSAPFEPARTAALFVGDALVGFIGEYRQAVCKELKLPAQCAGFEINIPLLSQVMDIAQYQPLSRFPKVEQDICLKVAASLPHAELYDFVSAKVDEYKPANSTYAVSPVDIYQREDDTKHKQITFRLSIASHDKTLRDGEVAALLDQVAEAAHQELHATKI